jgi:hypothetical protein
MNVWHAGGQPFVARAAAMVMDHTSPSLSEEPTLICPPDEIP